MIRSIVSSLLFVCVLGGIALAEPAAAQQPPEFPISAEKAAATPATAKHHHKSHKSHKAPKKARKAHHKRHKTAE